MKVINVIEVVNNSVISVVSFGVVENQFAGDVMKEAEELFEAKVRENGYTEDEQMPPIETFIEDGEYHFDDYSVSILYSEVDA